MHGRPTAAEVAAAGRQVAPQPVSKQRSPGLDYRSRATLLGLPLLHIARGSLVDGRLRPGVALPAAVGAIATTHSYRLLMLIAIPLFLMLRALRQREEQGPQR